MLEEEFLLSESYHQSLLSRSSYSSKTKTDQRSHQVAPALQHTMPCVSLAYYNPVEGTSHFFHLYCSTFGTVHTYCFFGMSMKTDVTHLLNLIDLKQAKNRSKYSTHKNSMNITKKYYYVQGLYLCLGQD